MNVLDNALYMFKKRENVAEIEEGKLLSPKFDNDGLIPVITTCSKTKEILMHGYMNVEAFKLTIETKEAHYFSRSRKQIWHKGKTSGFVQKVKEIRIDDDQDAVWITVDIGEGASCHVGYRSCFYRSVPMGKIDNARNIEMKFSLCNYNWKLDEHDVVNTRRLEIKHNISPLLARCMMPIMNKLHREVLRNSNQKNLLSYLQFSYYYKS